MKKKNTTLKIALTGLMAALCFVGYTFFPAISASGTKIHLGNAFVVLGAYLLGGVYGGLAGAIGLALADILGGYAASAPRTFITKFIIGLIVGLIAHKAGKISTAKNHGQVLKWAILAALCGLGANLFIEPTLKWVWYTILIPDADKAASAKNAYLAITTFATLINTVINSFAAVVLYMILRPALNKAGLFIEIDSAGNTKNSEKIPVKKNDDKESTE